ncbi:SusC/RagA family TonB-linked outer membrane protein [Mucilaginibacter sp.]
MKKNEPSWFYEQFLWAMRIQLLIIMLVCSTAVLVFADAYAQSPLDKKVTIELKAESLKSALDKVSKVSGVKFLYGDDVAKSQTKITSNVKALSVSTWLDEALDGYPYSYSLVEDAILIKYDPGKLKKKATAPEKTGIIKTNPDPILIIGKVTDEKGNPIAGVTIRVKEDGKTTVTNEQGMYQIKTENGNTLQFSYVGFVKSETRIQGQAQIDMKLVEEQSALDEVHIIAYGTTTERLSTGSISKVSAADIAEQPVSNPLAALEGRVAGLVVTQGNGFPGSGFTVQIRGQNSIAQGSSPLFIVDGVPYSDNNAGLGSIGSVTGSNGLSPFNTINPTDIESIEVLKDAAATAIYGSRGANGVILITTKKGKAGTTNFNANVYTGVSALTKTPDYMNTQQYLQMRRSALNNDGLTADADNAPDLTVWDTTRYTNLKKLLLGNTAHTTDASLSLSGGNANTTFLLSAGYHRETTVLSNDVADSKGNVHLSFVHNSSDHKFNMTFTAGYTSDNDNLILADPSYYLTLSPDIPPLYDTNGKLNWQQGGVSFFNPLSILQDKYLAQTDNLLSNLVLSYKLTGHLTLRSSFGYNMINVNENSKNPLSAQDPNAFPEATSTFANSQTNNWIIEPQLEYITTIKKGKLDILAGATLQQNKTQGYNIVESGYTSDALLGSIAAGSTTSFIDDSYDQYKYEALFGRVNYNWEDKYLLSFSGRRDGSSRFGPGKQFADFGAFGAAWIFSNEAFFKKWDSFISFGKIRGSYGVTGNDQIGNYKYLDAWKSGVSYNGTATLKPSNLYNPEYGWEVNKKLEAALDLGFLKDRILLSASVYRNLSSNQLVAYILPSQTGFANINENFPALVENKGLEITLSSKNVTGKHFTWTTNLNLTLPRNKLLSFPGLATSPYSNLVIGQPLSVVGGYLYTGVSSSTGLFTFKDINNDGTISRPADYVNNVGNLDPKFYGGLQNSFSYKGIQLDIFFQFKKQTGVNYLYDLYYNYGIYPGTMYNLPTNVLNAWYKSGDVATTQKFTTGSNSDAVEAANNLGTSNAIYTDASFIRLKTLSLSYTLPKSNWLEKLKLESCRIYVQGQNLLTITGYKGADPETQSIFSLPPLKTLTAGIQLSF